jgi:hypothetical protein
MNGVATMQMDFARKLLTGVLVTWVAGCYLEVDEADDSRGAINHGHHPSPQVVVVHDGPANLPGSWHDRVQTCGAGDDRPQQAGTCVEAGDRRWHVTCHTNNCQAVDVSVHYMLTEDLGPSNRVVVEAFDNPRFRGWPLANLEISNFDATGPGKSKADVLFLDPGEYYFRAYVSTDDHENLPYEYQGMILVGNRPVGYFGALSGPTKVVVDPAKGQSSPATIYLDTLLKRPGEDLPTHAHLRLKLSVAEGTNVPLAHKVFIQILERDDFSYDPNISYEVASETFMIVGREGTSEFVSPDMPIGRYFVRVFLDLDSNGFLDEGEPVAYYVKNGEHGMINIEANRTETISLVLAP